VLVDTSLLNQFLVDIGKDLDTVCLQMVILISEDMHASFIRCELGEVPWAQEISLIQIVT